jgi:hypothetical protein
MSMQELHRPSMFLIILSIFTSLEARSLGWSDALVPLALMWNVTISAFRALGALVSVPEQAWRTRVRVLGAAN